MRTGKAIKTMDEINRHYYIYVISTKDLDMDGLTFTTKGKSLGVKAVFPRNVQGFLKYPDGTLKSIENRTAVMVDTTEEKEYELLFTPKFALPFKGNRCLVPDVMTIVKIIDEQAYRNTKEYFPD